MRRTRLRSPHRPHRQPPRRPCDFRGRYRRVTGRTFGRCCRNIHRPRSRRRCCSACASACRSASQSALPSGWWWVWRSRFRSPFCAGRALRRVGSAERIQGRLIALLIPSPREGTGRGTGTTRRATRAGARSGRAAPGVVSYLAWSAPSVMLAPSASSNLLLVPFLKRRTGLPDTSKACTRSAAQREVRRVPAAGKHPPISRGSPAGVSTSGWPGQP